MFLEHFGSKKSNHGVFSLFFAHHGCDNCVEGSDSRISCLSLSRFCSAFVQDLAVAMELESHNQVRLFQQTVHRLAQALPGRYRGSRHAAVRYIYIPANHAGQFHRAEVRTASNDAGRVFRTTFCSSRCSEGGPASQKQTWLSTTYFLGILTSVPPTCN